MAGEGAGTLTVANGTVSLPSYAFLNDTDCGWYRIGANNIGGSIGGTKLVDMSAALFAVTGAITATTNITTTSPSASFGYATGAGGTVTQITSKATGVSLNASCGQIVTHNAALAANTAVSFTLTNTNAVQYQTVILNHHSGGTVGGYTLNASAVGGGSVVITIRNVTAGSLSEALTINFAFVKMVTS